MEKKEYSFNEVMRQWKRKFETEHILADGDTVGIDALWLAMDNPEKIESMVMTWAEQNPEPVYPTWEEWLQSIGVMESVQSTKERCQRILLVDGIVAHAIPTTKVVEPIPADIAEKLNIKPKEREAR